MDQFEEVIHDIILESCDPELLAKLIKRHPEQLRAIYAMEVADTWSTVEFPPRLMYRTNDVFPGYRLHLRRDFWNSEETVCQIVEYRDGSIAYALLGKAIEDFPEFSFEDAKKYLDDQLIERGFILL